MFGKRTTTFGKDQTTTNTTCAIADYNILSPDLRSIYHKFLFGTLLVGNIGVGTYYFFILRTLRVSKNRLKKFTCIQEVQQDQAHISTITSPELSLNKSNSSHSSEMSLKQTATVEDQMQIKEKEKSRTKKSNKHESKTAIISLVVMVTFMLSFVPMIVVDSIIYVTQLDPEQLTGAHLVLHSIFIRSVYINTIANPIIYGVMNKKFRNAVYNIFRKTQSLHK